MYWKSANFHETTYLRNGCDVNSQTGPFFNLLNTE